MRLTNLAFCLNKWVPPISRVASSIGAGVLAVMMFLTAMDVLLRYFLNRPIPGTLELAQYMMVFVVVAGFASCTVEKSHVRVLVLIERLSPRVQTIVYIITSFLSLCFFAAITWQGIKYALILFDDKMTSPVWLIPAFPFPVILALGTAVFCLAILEEFLSYLSQGGVNDRD